MEEQESMNGPFEDIKALQRYPLSCEKLESGLLFHFSDGTSKFIPDWTPPPTEPEDNKRSS